MNLIGTKVIHKSFGGGIISEIDDEKIYICFEDETKKFVFPDCFYHFLAAVDESETAYIKQLISEKETTMLENRSKKEIKTVSKEQTQKRQSKKDDRNNIAFKCNFCDGGKSKKQIGFQGVCSDEVIYNNIEVEHRTWCSAEDCSCLHYWNGELTREELDDLCTDGGSVCYESQMLREWKATAGFGHHGKREDKPMKLLQVKNNSLCILTTRNPGDKEQDRYIFAVFLIGESDTGNERDAGYVTATSKYKIKLTPQESHSLLFWNYHANQNEESSPAWASGLHRYFGDIMAAQILRDISEAKKGTNDYSLAVEFLKYFCKINKVDVLSIGSPKGALQMND